MCCWAWLSAPNAGLVTMHPLGQRRIYALRRESLRELRQWLDALDTAHPADHPLERYVATIDSERTQAAHDPRWAIGRRIRIQRQLTAGHFLTVTPPQRLRFELSHLTASEAPVFTALHDLHLTDHGQRTQLNLAIRITAASPAAAAAVAGIRPGWEQLLSKLARALARGSQP